LLLLKCGLTASQIAEIGNVWYKIDQKGYTPLSDFTKFGLGEGLPSLHPHVKFYRCGFKIYGLTATKIAKIGNFWYIFAPKGYIPFSNFYKIWRGERLPRTHSHANFRFCGFKNVALWPQKSPKIAIFGINLPLRKNLGGP